MNTYQCLLCDYCYDEAVGIPHEGIPAGTKWEDIPESWSCPDCGANKYDFYYWACRIALSMTVKIKRKPIVIIGIGIAGYSLARELRRLSADVPILIVTKDHGDYYSKPILSVALSKKKAIDSHVLRTASDIEKELSLSILVSENVQQIRPESQEIILESNKEIAYEKLVIATGANTRKLPILNEHVHQVNHLIDYQKFYEATQGSQKIAIIGGG